MTPRALNGYFRLGPTRPYVDRGVLFVALDRTGNWVSVRSDDSDFEDATRIIAQEGYNETDLSGEVRVAIVSSEYDFEFYPDAGECERVGLPVQLYPAEAA